MEPKYTHGMVAQIIGEDAARYKNHNSAYHDNPIAEINLALEALQKNSIWRERWDRFTANMVLSKDKLSYDDAMNSLVTHSEPLLAYLSKAPIMDFSNISHHESPMDVEKKFWGQSVIARELTQLYEHENPHIKRLIKLHKLGIEQGYTSELIKGMNNAITQLASNKAIMRMLEVNTPTLYTKTKAVQHALHTEQDISH